MSSEHTFVDYLDDILDAVEKAETFINGMDYDEFEDDEKTVFAVIRALEIIGEASNKIPRSVQKDYPDVSWHEISGMRNKLIHDYMGVNKKVVWKTVNEDLTQLEKTVIQMKEDFSETE